MHKLLVVALEKATVFVTEALALSQPAEQVIEAVVGPCCPVVRCKFAPAHTPHYYNDNGSEGRCHGRGC